MDVVDELLSGTKAPPKQRDVVDELLSPTPPVSAPPVSAGRDVGYLEGLGRSFTQGALAGFGDEVIAGVDATIAPVAGPVLGDAVPYWQDRPATWRERYDQRLASERRNDKSFKEKAPFAATGTEVVGGLTTALAMPGVLGGAQTMAGTMGRGAVAGATGGAVAGFGSGENGFENRVGNAVIPAAVGAVVGGLAPPVVNMVGKVAGRVADATGLRNNTRAAYRQILRAMGRDQAGGGPGLDDIRASMAANTGDNYRPEMLPDIAGENVRTLAERAARTPSTAAQTGKTAVRDRMVNQAGRVSDDVARLVSPKADFAGTVDDLLAQRSKDATPAYEAAFQQSKPVDVAPILKEIDDALKTAKGGIRTALQNARNLFLNQDGAVDTTLAGLHQTKLAMDDLIAARGETSLGRVAKRQVIDIQKKLLAAMDDASTVNGTSLYGEARSLFAGPSKALDALEMGRAVLKEDADVTAREIAAMTPNEKEFFLAGVARGIRDRLGGVGDNRNAVASIWGKPALRDKLQAAFPDAASFKQFGALMDREMRMAETGGRLLSGSRTEELRAAGDDMKIDPSFLNQAMQGNILQGAQGAGMRYFFGPRTQGMNSATADELARILYSTNQGENMQTLARLAREANRPTYLSDRAMQELARRLTLGTGVAVGTQSN